MAYKYLANAVAIGANKVREYGPFLFGSGETLRGGITSGSADASIEEVGVDGTTYPAVSVSLGATLTTTLNNSARARWLLIRVASGTAGTLTFDKGS
jgi:hypothetical protein